MYEYTADAISIYRQVDSYRDFVSKLLKIVIINAVYNRVSTIVPAVEPCGSRVSCSLLGAFLFHEKGIRWLRQGCAQMFSVDDGRLVCRTQWMGFRP